MCTKGCLQGTRVQFRKQKPTCKAFFTKKKSGSLQFSYGYKFSQLKTSEVQNLKKEEKKKRERKLFILFAVKNPKLEPSFKGLESSAATGHGNISDLHNSVNASGGMTAKRQNA